MKVYTSDTLGFVRTYNTHLRNNPLAHHMVDDFSIIWDGTMHNAIHVKFFKALGGYRSQVIIPSISWGKFDMRQLDFIFTLPDDIHPDNFQEVLLNNNLINFDEGGG